MGRVVVAWLVAVGVLASLLVAVPMAGPVAAAPDDPCDSNGDGVDDGEEDLIVSNGRDGEADVLEDRFDVEVASIEDPDRWFVSVCVGVEDTVLDGPTRGLSPDAPDWEEEARINALVEARKDFYRPYPWVMPDHAGLQTVNAESWLAVDPVVYEPGNRRIVADATVSGVRVEVIAVAVGAEFVFSDGVTVVCPIDRNVVYDAALLPDVPCGRDWEEPSERGGVSFEVGIQYEFTWTSSLGNVSPAASTVVSNPLSEYELEVTEIQAFLSEDGTSVPDVPEFGRLPSVREGDDGCSGFSIIYKPDCLASFVIEQILENLPPAIRAVIETVVDFVEGCVDYGIDAAGDVIASLGQVVEFARDPDAFINEKWVQAQELYNAIQADPVAFGEELGESVLREELKLDLYDAGEYATWAGYVGCKAIVAFLTGGGASAKVVKTLTDIVDKKFPDTNFPDRKPGDDNDPNRDPDGPTCRVGGSCSCDSFPAGTPVLMADGSHAPIELVKPGDRVLTYNTDTGAWSGNDVLAQWSGVHTEPMVTVTMADGSTVSSTDDHLFWVSSNGEWVGADQLKPGDLLLTPDGVTPIAGVTVHEAVPTIVWELDTANDDTYVIRGGPSEIVVHNCDEVYDADGNLIGIRSVRGDGTVEWLDADGTIAILRTDNSWEVEWPDGTTRSGIFPQDIMPTTRYLDRADHDAILDYTGNGFTDINNGLRNGTVDADLQARVDAVREAMKKLPVYEGTVYRNVDMNDRIRDMIDDGEWFDDTFQSTSLVGNFGRNRNVRLEIQSKTGVVLGDAADPRYAHQSEVLFSPETRFDIVDKYQDADGVWHLTLVEQ